MTLIIGAWSYNAALIASDMRLSNNGTVIEDESVKAGQFRTASATLIYAYAGLARWGTVLGRKRSDFATQSWITTALLQSHKPWLNLMETMRALQAFASHFFKTDFALSTADKKIRKLSILFMGYDRIRIGSQIVIMPVTIILSNFEDVSNSVRYSDAQDEFYLYFDFNTPLNHRVPVFLGSPSSVFRHRKKELHDLVKQPTSVDILKGKSQQIMAEAAESPFADNSVGPNVILTTLRVDRPHPESIYLSGTGGQRIHLMAMTDARSGLGIAAVQLNVKDKFSARPHKNSPCRCGSGAKYKKCCGRLSSNG